MTNEELAVEIQQGNKALIPHLWGQVWRLVCTYANRCFSFYGDVAIKQGIEVEDLIQEGYFALLEAVQAYDQYSDYKFTTYMRYPIKKRFNAVLGFRTAKGRNSVLSNAISLDKPMGEDGNSFLIDTIEDHNNDMLDIDDKIYNTQLKTDLEHCIKSALNPQQEKAIRLVYYKGMTLPQTAECMQIAEREAVNIKDGGLRAMRKREYMDVLKKYRMDVIETNAYRSGFNSWKNTGTSSTEMTALKLVK